MSKNTRQILLLLFTLLVFKNSYSQEFQIGYNYLQGVAYTGNTDLFKGGSELYVRYHKESEKLHYSGGLSFRTVQWGNQIALDLGALKALNDKFEIGVDLQNGMALFHTRKLYVLGLGTGGNYTFFSSESLQIGVSVFFRYTVCPAYKKYSHINSVFEIPIGVFFRF